MSSILHGASVVAMHRTPYPFMISKRFSLVATWKKALMNNWGGIEAISIKLSHGAALSSRKRRI